jgi:hypothetical protein
MLSRVAGLRSLKRAKLPSNLLKIELLKKKSAENRTTIIHIFKQNINL